MTETTSSPSTTTLFITLLLILPLALILHKTSSSSRKRRLPLPPGPKGLPLLGNIFDLPPTPTPSNPDPEPEAFHWLKHKSLYGGISSVTVLGQTMILIHDRDVAVELMEKRAGSHSGRPGLKFGFDLVGWINTMAGQQNNPTHRLYRRYAHQQLGSKAAVARHSAVQEVAVGRFLWRMKRDAGRDLTGHLKTEAAELILRLTYTYTITPHSPDPLVDLVTTSMHQFSLAAVPGKWAVDILPFLADLPSWFPGTGFKKTAARWRATLMAVADVPYEFAKGREGSFVAVARAAAWAERNKVREEKMKEEEEEKARTWREKGEDRSKDESDEEKEAARHEHAIKWAAASLYTGGSDTSVSTVSAFFLAMSLHPSIQRLAQLEIDSVVGKHRLPSFSDRDNLPYVNAIVEEAQRWHPIALLGLPHATDKEDEIRGFRIPRGAVLMPSIYWFTRDPDIYHDPEVFKPERFLPPYNEPSATSVTFGFGRRVCPGRVLADSMFFLTFAQTLAVFDVGKDVDGQGREVEPLHGFESGVIAYPKAFGVRVTPRSEEHARLIDGVVENHPWEDGDAKFLDLSAVQDLNLDL